MSAADDYVRRVEEELVDLPWSQRQDIAADLRRHLAELPAGTSFYAQLGPPEKYAADLRVAAGLEHRRGPIAYVRSFRPRNVIAIAAGIAALALGITALVWIASYQPLAFGGASVYPPGARLMVGAAQSNVPFREGKPFRVGMSIVNNGPFTVRVLGVTGEYAQPFGWQPLLHRRLVVAGPLATGGTHWVTPYKTFRPIDLPPGKPLYLQLNGTYGRECTPWFRGDGSVVMGGFQLRYRFLWHTGTAQIDFPYNLSTDFPTHKHCRRPSR